MATLVTGDNEAVSIPATPHAPALPQSRSNTMLRLRNIPRLISHLLWYWRAMEQLDKLWTSNKYQELISYCNELLTKKPTDFFALYYRRLSNEKLNLLNDSLEDFRQSEITLANYKRKALFKEYFTKIPIQISRVYRKLQDNEKTFEYADKAVHADKTEIDGLKWRASLKEDMGD